ncbi:hypothetical protein [Limosilactobacillus reuteri]|uniref:hypothetical protein n=1 Tax=Limosilactobacillus reuteri TaxID=1598 RepID=UPI0015E87133|nr:hypothetical protein [Limosilactobacillus reuteri]
MLLSFVITLGIFLIPTLFAMTINKVFQHDEFALDLLGCFVAEGMFGLIWAAVYATINA